MSNYPGKNGYNAQHINAPDIGQNRFAEKMFAKLNKICYTVK